MNNNTNKIIVICNSDIILKGLAGILTECNSEEVILLHRVNELIDYPHLSGYILLIMPVTVFEGHERYIKRMFSNASQMELLNLNFEEQSGLANTGISIHDDQALIISRVNGFLSTFGTKNNDKTINELTKREMDVLQLVAKGLANKEVAEKLFISIHTVISHRKNISEKTGIKSASGLTMYAVLKKIIDIDEISTSDLI